MPESCSSCGEPMAPAERMTSRRARMVWVPLFAMSTSMPVARFLSSPVSTSIRRLWALVMTVRLGRDSTGRRNALLALQRFPRR